MKQCYRLGIGCVSAMLVGCAASGAISYSAASGSVHAMVFDQGYFDGSASFVRNPAAPIDYYVLHAHPYSLWPNMLTADSQYTVWCRDDRLYTQGNLSVYANRFAGYATASMDLHVEFTIDAEVEFSVRLWSPRVRESITGSLRSATTEYLSEAYAVGAAEWSGTLGPGSYVLDLAASSTTPDLWEPWPDPDYHGGAYWEVSIPSPPTFAWLAVGVASLRRRRSTGGRDASVA